MSDPDAYRDEMGILLRLSDRDAERLLSSREAPDEPELIAFFGDVRAVYGEAPVESTEALHLAAVAQALSSGHAQLTLADRSASPPVRASRRAATMPGRRLVLLGAGLVVAALLATAGLAVAGVSLPGGARAPFEQVGIELPNQSSASDVQAIIRSTLPDQRGCAFGQQVAQAANGGKGGPSGDSCAHQGDHASGDKQGSASDDQNINAGGAGRSFGQQTAAGAQQNASGGGQTFGQGTAQSAQQLGQQQSAARRGTGDHNAVAGQATGQVNSAAGRATGDHNSAAGQATAQNNSPAREGTAGQTSGRHVPK
jgi:hypothetical protein